MNVVKGSHSHLVKELFLMLGMSCLNVQRIDDFWWDDYLIFSLRRYRYSKGISMVIQSKEIPSKSPLSLSGYELIP